MLECTCVHLVGEGICLRRRKVAAEKVVTPMEKRKRYDIWIMLSGTLAVT